MKKRASNIELLRIIAMLMIVASHFACHGIQHCNDLNNAYKIWGQGAELNKLFVSFLNPGGMIGVACFFLITGYFNIEKKTFTLKRVILQGSFYGIFSVILFICAKLLKYNFLDVDSSMLFSTVIKSVFVPNTNGGCWWFLTAYIYLMLLTPFLNKLVEKLNKRGYIFLLIVTWITIYSLDGTLFGLYWSIQRGVMFYLLGGFIRKNVNTKKIDQGGRILLLLIIFLSWFIDSGVMYITNKKRYLLNNKTANLFDSISVIIGDGIVLAVPVVICSISIFLLFLSLDFNNNFINKIAKTTFGIYLIHDSIFARSFIWHGILKVDTFWYTRKFFPVYSIVLIFAVFVVCSIIDMLRLKFIEPVMIDFVDKKIKIFKSRYMIDVK